MGRPRISAGRSDIARNSRGSEICARRHEPQARRQHRLEADRARRGFGERQPLGLDVLRIVVGDDDVDQAVSERLDQRQPLVLAAQRRVEFQEGAIVADVDLVEREMVDRDAAGDGEPRLPRARHRVERKRVGDEHGVIARPRQRGEAAGRARARSSRPRAGCRASPSRLASSPSAITPSPASARSSQ